MWGQLIIENLTNMNRSKIKLVRLNEYVALTTTAVYIVIFTVGR